MLDRLDMCVASALAGWLTLGDSQPASHVHTIAPRWHSARMSVLCVLCVQCSLWRKRERSTERVHRRLQAHIGGQGFQEVIEGTACQVWHMCEACLVFLHKLWQRRSVESEVDRKYSLNRAGIRTTCTGVELMTWIDGRLVSNVPGKLYSVLFSYIVSRVWFCCMWHILFKDSKLAVNQYKDWNSRVDAAHVVAPEIPGKGGQSGILL